MDKIFFTSDNHFTHRNIHKFCPATRPDADVNVMDQKMIQRWQDQVHHNDDVFLLGDVFFCNAEKAVHILDQLPGQKHLIYGNHDRVIKNSPELKSKFVSIDHYLEITSYGDMYCLFHYPIQEWNKIHHGSYHLHGHIHQRLNPMADEGLEAGRIVNVCIDSPTLSKGDYSLYEREEIKAYLDTQVIREHHDR